MSKGVVIVGGSIAGYNVAKNLRKLGYEKPITMINEEPVLPFDRSKLSKSWMLDEKTAKPPLFSQQDFFDKENIDTVLGEKVTEFSPEKKEVITARGQTYPYEKLVIATGSTLRQIPFPGSDGNGIFYLRDLKRAVAIKEWALTARKVVIVGAGFIGLELAGSLNKLGLEVTVVEYASYPLERIIGHKGAKHLVDLHEKQGVTFYFNEEVQSFEKDSQGNVTAIVTKNQKFPCDMAVIGVGVVPNESLTHPDLKRDGGILVDEYSQTSIPDVFACGDCTSWPYEGKLIHVEHWENAMHQGKNVAINIMDKESKVYKVRPYFWTDHYDETIEYLGHIKSWDQEVFRGNPEEKQFSIIYLDENKIPLAMLYANGSEKRKAINALLNKKEPLDIARFENPEIPLEEI